ncbi:MAG: DUF4097 family beta strand repeat protein [Clostridia bacterium]|nr:DUF4097 family beta strand repeat protein [Clostridia bacterium]
MKKHTKIWLIAATFLMIFGIILLTSVMTFHHWDFSRLSTEKYETNTYTVSETFRNISIQTDTADILFLPSEDGVCKTVCYESENIWHSVSVQNETLVIQSSDERDWYDYIGIFQKSLKITIYLPQNEYGSLTIKESTGDIEIPKDFQFKNIDISTSTGDIKNYASALETIKIQTSTGDIRVENMSAKAIFLSASTGKINVLSAICQETIETRVSTGKITLTDISCKNLISKGSTGDILMKNVRAEEKFAIERNTGDINFDDCDAREIFVKTSTGDVSGTLLSEKDFHAKSNTGHVRVPQSSNAGKCEIICDTGDIEIKIS